MNKSPLTTSDAIKMMLSYSGILILFGLTWLFAIFTFIAEPNVSFIVQFFFAFFNAFQGFFIFFFFVIINSDSRNAWKSLLCSWTVKDRKKPLASTTAKNKTSITKLTLPKEKNAPKYVLSNNEKDNKDNEFVKNSVNEAAIFEDEDCLYDDKFMISEFNSIRFERNLSIRRQHYVEKIEIDFFDDKDDVGFDT